MRKGRIAWTLVAALISEAINKIAPLLTLHLAATRLGVEAFGASQFALWILEWGILLVAFGYPQSIPLAIRQARSTEEKREIAGAVTAGRLMQAMIALIVILVLLATVPGWAVYRPAIVASSFILLTSAIEMSGLLLALQKNALVSLSMVAGKLASIAGIWWLVQSPEDSVAFVVITNGANAVVGTCTFLLSWKILGLRLPRMTRVVESFNRAAPFAGATMLLVALERFDLAIVEHHLGSTGAGWYSGPARLVQSITPLIAAISAVFFSEMIAIFDTKELRRHLRVSLLAMMSILLPVTAGTWFAGAGILALVFGSSFGSQGPVLSIMILACVAHGLILIAGFQMCALQQRIRPLFLALGAGLAAAILLGIPATAKWGLTGAAWSSVLGRWVAALIVTRSAMGGLDLRPYDFLEPAIKALIPTACMSAVVYAWQKAMGGGPSEDLANLGPLVLIGAVTYALCFLATNRKDVSSLFTQLSQRGRRKAQIR
ncbi:MAG: hypothetical protein RIQ81_1879 [Pseudomonadota bacterium]|jgi:O-antigen/teichoic acid export membrane protein